MLATTLLRLRVRVADTDDAAGAVRRRRSGRRRRARRRAPRASSRRSAPTACRCEMFVRFIAIAPFAPARLAQPRSLARRARGVRKIAAARLAHRLRRSRRAARRRVLAAEAVAREHAVVDEPAPQAPRGRRRASRPRPPSHAFETLVHVALAETLVAGERASRAGQHQCEVARVRRRDHAERQVLAHGERLACDRGLWSDSMVVPARRVRRRFCPRRRPTRSQAASLRRVFRRFGREAASPDGQTSSRRSNNDPSSTELLETAMNHKLNALRDGRLARAGAVDAYAAGRRRLPLRIRVR